MARTAARVKSLVKAASRGLGFYEQVSRFWIWLNPIVTKGARALTGRDRVLIDRYFATHPVARLQIGSGLNNLPEWLNSDLNPAGPQVYLDATERFPLPDNCLDTVYSEHMIEHVPWRGGQAMVRECYRVMKPGATIRIVTPNLAFLTRLLQEPTAPQHVEYIRYSMKQYEIDGPDDSAPHVVNNFMHAWGHQFIYDEATLRHLLSDAGFADIRLCQLDDSTQPALAGLSKADRMPAGFLAMESLVLEARKPLSPA